MPVTDRPHLKYGNIRDEAKTALTGLFDAKPHQADDPLAVSAPFIESICSAYNVPTPEVKINPHIWHRYSYRPGARFALSAQNEAGQITLQTFTIIDLLTALRKHINSHTNSRLDEHAWACSAYYSVKPIRFRKLVRENRMPGVNAAATYTTETWERLVSEGRADDESGCLIVEEVSDETIAAVAEFVETIIEEEAQEGIVNISDFLANAIAQNLPASTPAEEAAAEAQAQLNEDGLDSLNRDALRRLAAEHNVPGRGTMLADELRYTLRQMGVRA